tara:strand:- start:1055 stop:1486 length:432 start_codon:yes stop_codon:yes gene_type:complete
MFNKIFKKKINKNVDDKNILLAALLIHAAKIDNNYTDKEKQIIKKALMELNSIDISKAEKILSQAEKKEEDSNQIVGFTQEIKKNSMEYRINIIEILWKIVYSDGIDDGYESGLIRRVCGLLYVSDKDSGVIKLKTINSMKKI